MRTQLTFIFAVCFYTVSAQISGSFHVFLTKAEATDTGMVIVEVSPWVKVSDSKPETILVPKNYNAGYSIDDRPKKFYYQPKGEMSFLVYPRTDVLANLQPHIVLNVVGLSTYLSSKFGFGVTSRKYGVSLGFLYGKYLRRLDAKADISYRAKAFEDSQAFGGYLNIEMDYLSWSCLLMKEKTLSYHDAGARLRLGSMVNSRYVPTGLNLEFRSMTFLGTGFGLSYITPNQHHSLGMIFCIPDRAEKDRQRRFYNFLDSGVSINWRIEAF